MATKFHISESGKPAKCDATKKSCPKGANAPHFDTLQEAQAEAERRFAEKHDIIASKRKKATQALDKKTAKVDELKVQQDELNRIQAAIDAQQETLKAEQETVRRLLAHAERSSQAARENLEKITEIERDLKAPGFHVPESVSVDGYMGASGYEGGNYRRLIAEGKTPFDNKVITKEIRADIKEAIAAGHLPKKIGGSNVKYLVNSTGYNSINIVARVDKSELDGRAVAKVKNQWVNNLTGFTQVEQVSAPDERAEVQKKLQEISNSYNYNRSNSMVDYFDSGFYGKAEVKDRESWEEAHKAEKKAIRSVADSLDGSYLGLTGPQQRRELVDKKIETLFRDNKKVRDAIVSARNLENEKIIAQKKHNEFYNTFKAPHNRREEPLSNSEIKAKVDDFNMRYADIADKARHQSELNGTKASLDEMTHPVDDGQGGFKWVSAQHDKTTDYDRDRFKSNLLREATASLDRKAKKLQKNRR